ncbi:MAG: GNAT family N-acetyltransferase [Verrucomicrobiales bacterium]|nr:GNAT family N-acetyltransferase [Verrucomicrobiales bacterium]
MKISTPECSQSNPQHSTLFAQGAGCIASSEGLSAALWFKNTPNYQGYPVATIGECDLDDSQRAVDFISDCADYLHDEHECHTVIGPMNGNTWLRHRLLLDSNDRLPFMMEPLEPCYFRQIFEVAGFSILSRYSSSVVDLNKPASNYEILSKRLQQRGLRLRTVDFENFEKDLAAIFQLSLLSFQNNFLYTDLPEKAFIGKYLSAKDQIDPDFVLLAEVNGELVGYVFCLPDILAQTAGVAPALIIKTLASHPERKLPGLGTLLVAEVQRRAKEKGYVEAIHALQYESNSSLRISQRFDAKIFRRYALMSKSY